MKKYVQLSLIALGFAISVGLNIYVDKLNAQQPAPVAVPTPEIILRVTQSELDLISEGLQTQPFGKVVPLINKLRDQIIAQQPKPVQPEPPKPVEPKQE